MITTTFILKPKPPSDTYKEGLYIKPDTHVGNETLIAVISPSKQSNFSHEKNISIKAHLILDLYFIYRGQSHNY